MKYITMAAVVSNSVLAISDVFNKICRQAHLVMSNCRLATFGDGMIPCVAGECPQGSILGMKHASAGQI
jgi:hypothetical protein